MEILSTKNNVVESVTAIVKTHERPEKLATILASIKLYYPLMRVVVVDDSASRNCQNWDQSVTYLHDDYDIGLAEGRNRAVKLVETPYTLVLDDDFVFTRNTKIEYLQKILETSSYQLVSGDVFDNRKLYPRLWRGFFEVHNDHLILRHRFVTKKIEGQYRYDYVVNFFLAETDLLKLYSWDSELKLYEHVEFFWRLHNDGVMVAHSHLVSIRHFPTKIKNLNERKSVYYQNRHERADYFKKLCDKKIGVESTIEDNRQKYRAFGIVKYYMRLRYTTGFVCRKLVGLLR